MNVQAVSSCERMGRPCSLENNCFGPPNELEEAGTERLPLSSMHAHGLFPGRKD